MSNNPFAVASIPGCFATDVETRLHRLRDFTADQCRAALEVPGLQKVVRLALERRLRKLSAPSSVSRPPSSVNS